MQSYSSAVQAVRDIGYVGLGFHQSPAEEIDYAEEWGIGPAHIPELIRLAQEGVREALEDGELGYEHLEHACRALAQLGANEAAGPLIEAALSLQKVDDTGDWLYVIFVPLLARLAGEGTPRLLDQAYDREQGDGVPGMLCISALEKIGETRPELRQACVDVLAARLEGFAQQNPETNGFLVNALCTLKATETMPLIRRGFAAGQVSEMMLGGVEEAEHYMGLRPKTARMERDEARAREVMDGLQWGDPKLMAELQAVMERMQGQVQVAPREPARAPNKKIGRNYPCPCGSGKKYKHCCLNGGTLRA